MAQTPPPFQVTPPSAPATNSANKACIIAVCCVLLLCVVLILAFIAFSRNVMGEVTQTFSCVGMFEMSDNSLRAYALEHNGKLPQAATWQDDIAPYYQRLYDKMKTEKLPKSWLPPAPGEPLQCVWGQRKTGIAFNVQLSGKELKKIDQPTKTPVVFEVDKVGTNLAEVFVEQPKSKAPKVMYNDRDWIVYYVEGNKNPFETSKSGSASFELKPEDALPANSKAGQNSGSSGKPVEKE